MIEHLRTYWAAYWGIFASIGLILFRFARTDRNLSRGARLRSLIQGNRYFDPNSPAYDPGLPGRQLLLLLVGFPLIVIALVAAWLAAR